MEALRAWAWLSMLADLPFEGRTTFLFGPLDLSAAAVVIVDVVAANEILQRGRLGGRIPGGEWTPDKTQSPGAQLQNKSWAIILNGRAVLLRGT